MHERERRSHGNHPLLDGRVPCRRRNPTARRDAECRSAVVPAQPSVGDSQWALESGHIQHSAVVSADAGEPSGITGSLARPGVARFRRTPGRRQGPINGRAVVFGKMKDPMAGRAFVTSANDFTASMNPNRLHATVVVKVEGIPEATVEHSELVLQHQLADWPYAGQSIPVTIDRASPSHLKIDWDQLKRERNS
jgi:hypothetical protein